MTKKQTIIAIGAAGALAVAATQNLRFWSTQEALNVAVTGSVDPATIRQYSTQEASNIIAQATLGYEPHVGHMPGVFTMVAEDMGKGWAPDSSWSNSITSHGMTIGINVEMEQCLNVPPNDTTVLSMSYWDLQALYRRGFEMGTAGYDEIGGLYGSGGEYYIESLLSRGYTQAQEDSFYNNIERGVASQKQYGLGQPRWGSPSLESACFITADALAESGIEYFFTGNLPVTGGASYRPRWGQSIPARLPYTLQQARWGMWHTGGSAVSEPNETLQRGHLMDPYYIFTAQLGGKTLAQWKDQLDRAAQVGGLAIWLHHNASSIESETGITFDSLLTWIKEDYIDTGLLINLPPGEAFDYYYKRPITSMTSWNYGPACFNDIDLDGYPDGWGGGNGTCGEAADTALIKRWGAPTAGHNGGKAYSLNWGNRVGSVGASNAMLPGLAADKLWESTLAYYAVVPPPGGGWTARWQMWYKADSVGAGWSGVAGDTMGVAFYGPAETYTNRYGTVNPTHFFIRNNSNTYTLTASQDWVTPYDNPNGNWIRFGSQNRVIDPKTTWGFIDASWDVPESADYLYVAIWKGPTIPANGVVISDYQLTFFKKDVPYAPYRGRPVIAH